MVLKAGTIRRLRRLQNNLPYEIGTDGRVGNTSCQSGNPLSIPKEAVPLPRTSRQQRVGNHKCVDVAVPIHPAISRISFNLRRGTLHAASRPLKVRSCRLGGARFGGIRLARAAETTGELEVLVDQLNRELFDNDGLARAIPKEPTLSELARGATAGSCSAAKITSLSIADSFTASTNRA
jgi:hypothetical protein